jgi:hypothetical protein
MRCRRVQRLLPDYLGDELSTRERERVEGHLEACPDCRAELAALQGAWTGLAQQPLPQKAGEFWDGFTADVMQEIRKRRPVPAEKRPPLLVPWRVLLPAGGAIAAVIAGVIALKVVLGPGTGEWVAQDEAVVEIARSFSVAPLVAEETDPLGGLNGLAAAAHDATIALQPAEEADFTEALTQLFGEEDISAALEDLEEGEMEEFNRLLSSNYPYS